MKPLYYLEFAPSVDQNGQPIPAKELSWKSRWGAMVAYESLDTCVVERMSYQKALKQHVVRVCQAGWLKNLWIRHSSDWTVVEE